MGATSQDDDTALKEKGNAYFRQKKYRKAIQRYSWAIECCKSEENKAVYFSNRSNCHFELGEYEASIVDAK